jgi:hypothetical protein
MDRSHTEPPALSPSTEVLPSGEVVDMFKIKSFSMTNGVLRVSGDVHLLVDGDFTIGSNGGIFEILPDSSLTLYVTGKTKILKEILTGQGLTKSKVPVFSIYSSYSKPNGIEMDASGDVYAAIYAPNTDAEFSGGATFKGAIRAQTVTVSGGGGIHYDTQLGTIGNVSTGDGDGSGVTTRIRFVGWRYKTDDDDDG